MKYSSKVAALCISAAFATGFAFADGDIPTVTEVSMQQGSGNRIVTIKYKLDSYPAVVTLDVKTNDTVSIGGEHIWNAEGAVWRKVTSEDADGSGWCTITWDPTQSWKDGNGNGFKTQDVKAEVTAWPLDNTPDYMVVDISRAAQPNTQRYYPAVDFLPGSELGQVGAVTNNPIYKGSALLMRKIMAKGVTWTMGSTPLETQRETDGREATHLVALTNNYYIGVFEVTQDQWALVQTNYTVNPSYFTVDRAMRPVENVTYYGVRMGLVPQASAAISAYYWPAPPCPQSFLGALRLKTGIDFDLPSDSQWEFAARAGNGNTKWGDGSGIQGTDADENLGRLGRYKYSPDITVETGSVQATTLAADGGTAIVGSYKPNDWGIYDMHGNVSEWCLDRYSVDISALNGCVNTNSAINQFIFRGCGWSDLAKGCRPARRGYTNPSSYWKACGLRVACTAGLR